MTSDEIDKLEAGPLLDALVAEKVMGRHKWVPGGDRRELEANDEDPAIYFTCKQCGQNILNHTFPSYSTDIAAAWEVVEKLKTLEPRGHAKFGIHGCSPEIVIVWDLDHFYCNVDGQGTYREFHGEGDTAPLAICRAALKALHA